MPIKTIQAKRLYRQIADQLRALIEQGEFAIGSCLPPERELAAKLGVSRASVREALIALEVVGLVEVKVGHGVVVQATQALNPEPALIAPEPLAQDVLPYQLDLSAEIPPFALLQARRLIEPEAAALAATQATPQQLAAIQQALAWNLSQWEQPNESLNLNTHPGDRLFHIRIAEASGNLAYAQFIGLILSRPGTMYRRLQALYTPKDMPRRSADEHIVIMQALEQRDASAARRAMRYHLDQVMHIFERAVPQ